MTDTRAPGAFTRAGDGAPCGLNRPDQIALAAARSDVWRAQLASREHDLGVGLGTVLEIGCGTGAVARWACHQDARVVLGLDLHLELLVTARAQLPTPGYLVADACALPVPDGAIDIAICSTLFSSVLDETVARDIAREIDRAASADGMVLWFDVFSRRACGPGLRAVRVADLARWFPGWRRSLRRVVLAPPLARRLGRVPRVADALAAVPMLRTHYAGVLTRR
jgi:SAM-dependent methyltransferase